MLICESPIHINMMVFRDECPITPRTSKVFDKKIVQTNESLKDDQSAPLQFPVVESQSLAEEEETQWTSYASKFTGQTRNPIVNTDRLTCATSGDFILNN